MTLLDKQSGSLVTYDIRTGEKLSVDGVVVQKSQYGYSLEIADAVCNLLREGHTLTKISKMDNMPQLTVLYRWMSVHPDFKKMVEAAKVDRGSYNLDKAQTILEEIDPEDTPRDVLLAKKFQFEGHIKLAEKDNPKLLEKAQGAAPLQIVVNTGIIRGEPTTVEVNGQGISVESGQRVSVETDLEDGGDSGGE